jgi:cytochrome P460
MLAIALAACGGAPATATAPAATDREGHLRAAAAAQPEDAESVFGPLEVGADYASYRKVTDQPFQSLDHGNRWVDVYVNAVGVAAYLSGAPVPVGTIVVKTSWQDGGGRPSRVVGPLFIMEKRAPGYAPEHDDWYFAIHWANPPAAERKKFGGPFYWRGKSKRAAYCWECHDLYDRRLGGLTPSSQLPR